jgi:TatA/E family protein of Tat protein translocase
VNIGTPELILILVIALVVFGPKRLPEVGRTIGKSLREFRKASQDLRDEFQFSMDEDDLPVAPLPVASPTAAERNGDSTGGGAKPKTKAKAKANPRPRRASKSAATRKPPASKRPTSRKRPTTKRSG